MNQHAATSHVTSHGQAAVSHARPVVDGGEASSAVTTRPTPLSRVSLEKPPDERSQSPQDRRRSPNRVSPRSPPRSPSWLRSYKESPPRSPGMIILSPTKSPTERFPQDLPYGERDDDAYGADEFVFPDHQPLDGRRSDGYESTRPPPKPARMSAALNVDVGDQKLDAHLLDVASYAATIASNTAHLTSMSVSPVASTLYASSQSSADVMDAVMHDDDELMSPHGYYDNCEELLEEATEKSIDYENTQRQKVKPPATDWSPITDLSPIMDVSPSLEKIEQEQMLAEQQKSNHRQEQVRGHHARLEPPYTGSADLSKHGSSDDVKERSRNGAREDSSAERQFEPSNQLRNSQQQPQKPVVHDVINNRFERHDGSAAQAQPQASGGRRLVDWDYDDEYDSPPQKRVINIDRSQLVNRDDHLMCADDDDVDVPFERQGGLVRSKVRFFSQSQDEPVTPPKHSLSDDELSMTSSLTQRAPAVPSAYAAKHLQDVNSSEAMTSGASPADTAAVKTVRPAMKSIRRSQSLDNPSRVSDINL